MSNPEILRSVDPRSRLLAFINLMRFRRKPRPATPQFMAGYATYDFKRPFWAYRRFMIGLAIFTFFYTALFTLMPRSLSIMFLVPVGLLWGMVLWSLPVQQYHPGRALDRLFIFYSFSIILIPAYVGLAIPGLPWINTVRLFGAPAILLLLYYSSTSQPFRAEMQRMTGAARWILWLVVAFALLQIVSMFVSDVPTITFTKVLNNQIAWTGMFFIALWHFRDIDKMRKWIVVYLFCMIVVGILAIVESQAERILWLDIIPDILLIKDDTTEAIFAGGSRFYGGYRVSGTSTSPLSFAELSALATPFALYIMDQYRTVKAYFAGLSIIVLCVTTIILTDSRLGLVSALAGLLVYSCYFLYHRWKTSHDSMIAVAGVVFYPVIAAVVLAASFLIGRIRNHVWGTGGHAQSNDARIEQATLALEKIWASPVIGFGASRGGPKVGWVAPGGELSIDTYYVSILMDYGFVGLFVFYGLFIGCIVKAFKIAISRNDYLGRLAAGWGTYLVVFLTTKAVLSQEINHALLFAGFAAVAALSAATYTAKDGAKTGQSHIPLQFNQRANVRRLPN